MLHALPFPIYPFIAVVLKTYLPSAEQYTLLFLTFKYPGSVNAPAYSSSTPVIVAPKTFLPLLVVYS